MSSKNRAGMILIPAYSEFQFNQYRKESSNDLNSTTFISNRQRSVKVIFW